MEIEYKWEMPEDEVRSQLLDGLRRCGELGSPQQIYMQACYYDTPDHYVYNLHGGLRRRIENDASVCCLKLSVEGDNGCKVRREFEVEADDIRKGLELLKAVGAPSAVCNDLLSRELVPLCKTNFERLEYEFHNDTFAAKLAFDSGHMSRQERQAPIFEMEFEFVSGSEEAFHAFARQLERQCELEVQPKSKLARAASL